MKRHCCNEVFNTDIQRGCEVTCERRGQDRKIVSHAVMSPAYSKSTIRTEDGVE